MSEQENFKRKTIDATMFVSARRGDVNLPVMANFNGRYLWVKTRMCDNTGNVYVIIHRIDLLSVLAVWRTLQRPVVFEKR